MGEEKLTHIFKAIAGVQDDITVIGKDSQGYGYEYVSMVKLVTVLRPILRKHGLVFAHAISHIEGPDTIHPALATTLTHIESGELLSAICPLIPSGIKKANDSQQIGSDVTYKRRYQELAMLDIPHGDDADERKFNEPGGTPPGETASSPSSGSSPDWGDLKDEKGCLEMIDAATSMSEIEDIYRAHEARSHDEGWNDAVVGLCGLRRKELEGD